MNVKNSLKMSSIGLAGGIIFRVLSVLYFFDRTTGFYTDNGFWAWICAGFVMITALLSAFMSMQDKKTFFAPYSGTKNRLLSVMSFLSGAGLIAMAVVQLKSFLAVTAEKGYNQNVAAASWIHLALIILSALFGLLQIFLVPFFFVGWNIFIQIPALYLLSVLWGIVNLMFMFIYYSQAVLRQENIYVIFSGALLLLALYYLSRYFVGIGKEQSARLCYVFGFPAMILSSVHILSNLLIYLLLGIQTTLSEVPLMIQVAQLGVVAFVFVALVTIRKYDLHEPAGSRRMKSRHSASSKTQTDIIKKGEESVRMRTD